MTSDLELALCLADAADAISLPLFGAGLAVERKADLTPVTEADRSVEAELRRQLAEARPDEAGGTFTDYAGEPRIDGLGAISSNGLLHAELVAAVAGRARTST